jgi:hypothetical protein
MMVLPECCVELKAGEMFLGRQSLAAANDVCGLRRLDVQPIFRRRRHQPRRPPLAKIRPC